MENISEYIISDIEINENNVKSAPDQLAAEGETSPRDVKHIFDRLPELIAQRLNSFVIAVKESFYTKNEIDTCHSAMNAEIAAKADSENVYTKDQTLTTDEIRNEILNWIPESGNGDMFTGIYDVNGNGVVDAAEFADTAESAHNGIFVYTHTAGAVTGSGVHGYFKATVTETLSSVKVNGTAHTVRCGNENTVELVKDNIYSFIIDDGAATINFKAGGGVSSSKLAGATATAAKVLKGYTFYAGDKTLKTGTLTSSGIVKKSQTVSGKTSMNPGIVGTITLTFDNLTKIDGISAVTATQSSTSSSDLRVALNSIAISGNKATLKFKNGSTGYVYTQNVSVTAFQNTL